MINKRYLQKEIIMHNLYKKKVGKSSGQSDVMCPFIAQVMADIYIYRHTQIGIFYCVRFFFFFLKKLFIKIKNL